jgi:phosphotransferase system IIB component
MTTRAPATQATIARAIRAAKKNGAREVVVEGASIRIVLGTDSVDSGNNRKAKVAKRPERLI